MPKCKPDKKENVDIPEKWTWMMMIFASLPGIVIPVIRILVMLLALLAVDVYLYQSPVDIPRNRLILPILMPYLPPEKVTRQANPPTTTQIESPGLLLEAVEIRRLHL